MKINFVERFVFTYDASQDGLGIMYDVYEMYHVEDKETIEKIYNEKTIQMTKEQHDEIVKILEINNEIEIVVFYELNKIPLIAYYGEDYVELTDKIYESKDRYISRNKYKEIKTTPQTYNWVKNNLKFKYMRHAFCNLEEEG